MKDPILPRVMLTKIRTNHSRVRTKTMKGIAQEWPPKIGRRFVLWGRGLEDRRLTREIDTSAIIAVRPDSTRPVGMRFEIDTRNSTYRLERI